MELSPISIKRNYAFKLAYQVLSLIMPLITTPYIARVLGADGVGVYSYTSSIMAYFTMFAALGTINYGTREIARSRDDKQKMSDAFWGIELMTVCTTLIALVIWLVLIAISTQYHDVFFALMPLLIASAADISWLYTGIEKVHYTVLVNFLFKIIGVISIFIFIKSRNDLVLYVFIMSLITCLGNASMWLFLPRVVIKPQLQNIKMQRHFKETLKYFLTSIAISIYTILDKTMIGLLTKNTLENGYYEQASKLISVVKPVAFVTMNDIMLPRMSYLFAKNSWNEINDRINMSLSLELMLSTGCCFGLITIADVFVPLFFGNGYEPVALLVKLLAPILIFICISTCIGSHYYLPSGNILFGTKLTSVGSLINILVNLPLIFWLGSKGAVLASLLSEGVIALLYVHFSKKEIALHGLWKQLSKKLLAGTVMLLICTLIGNYIRCPVIVLLGIQVVSGVMIYIIVLTVLKDDSIALIYKILIKCFKSHVTF